MSAPQNSPPPPSGKPGARRANSNQGSGKPKSAAGQKGSKGNKFPKNRGNVNNFLTNQALIAMAQQAGGFRDAERERAQKEKEDLKHELEVKKNLEAAAKAEIARWKEDRFRQIATSNFKFKTFATNSFQIRVADGIQFFSVTRFVILSLLFLNLYFFMAITMTPTPEKTFVRSVGYPYVSSCLVPKKEYVIECTTNYFIDHEPETCAYYRNPRHLEHYMNSLNAKPDGLGNFAIMHTVPELFDPIWVDQDGKEYFDLTPSDRLDLTREQGKNLTKINPHKEYKEIDVCFITNPMVTCDVSIDLVQEENLPKLFPTIDETCVEIEIQVDNHVNCFKTEFKEESYVGPNPEYLKFRARMDRDFGPKSSFFFYYMFWNTDYLCAANGLLGFCFFGIWGIIYLLSLRIRYEYAYKIKTPSFKILRPSYEQDHPDMRTDNYDISGFKHKPDYVVVRYRNFKPRYVVEELGWADSMKSTASDTWVFRAINPHKSYTYDLKNKTRIDEIPYSYFEDGQRYRLVGLEPEDITFEISLAVFNQVCTPNKLHFCTDREVRKEMVSRAINRISSVNADTTRHLVGAEDGLTYQSNVLLATQHFIMAYIDNTVNDGFADAMKNFY